MALNNLHQTATVISSNHSMHLEMTSCMAPNSFRGAARPKRTPLAAKYSQIMKRYRGEQTEMSSGEGET